MWLFAVLNVAQIVCAANIEWEQPRPKPIASVVIGATIFAIGVLLTMWLARCVWSGRKVGWALGLIAFYLFSFAFAIALVLATEGTPFAPASFVALLALVLASLLASLVFLTMALFTKSRADSQAHDAKADS